MTMGKPAGIVLHLDLATNTLVNTTLNASTHITHNVILQQTKILESRHGTSSAKMNMVVPIHRGTPI